MSLDFIIRLSKVDDMWSILVVVDGFFKYDLLIIAPHVYFTNVIVELFQKYFVKCFGVLDDIISDRDICFIGKFWMMLFKLLRLS